MKALPLLLALLLAACASIPSEQQSFVPVQSQQAMIQWRRTEASLIGEAVFARAADGSVQARLYKSSPKALLVLSLDQTGILRASGPLSGFGWKGFAGSAPLPLSTWARLMEIYRIVRTWPDGTREIQGGTTRSLIQIDKGPKLQSLTIVNDLNAERITVRFQ